QGAASDQIAQILSQSLWIAFLAAASAAIGEEILFRGALQPIFGLIPTTLLFALLHSQYAFTPGSLAIVLVGGVFGWLKNRQRTTAAIIAHFTYNFVLLMFAYIAFRLEEMGITPESLQGILSFL
ncbi:MAG: CPBP family intramembrane glutamic endopeptidase, partial [Chloroflexota bacterium]